jgi:hypothetical protein
MGIMRDRRAKRPVPPQTEADHETESDSAGSPVSLKTGHQEHVAVGRKHPLAVPT